VGPAAQTGLTPIAGSFVRMRALVSGANPTTIQLKAWADGTAEPAGWQFTGTNSNPALQGAGAVGVRSYVSSVTNAPIAASDHDRQRRLLSCSAAAVGSRADRRDLVLPGHARRLHSQRHWRGVQAAFGEPDTQRLPVEHARPRRRPVVHRLARQGGRGQF